MQSLGFIKRTFTHLTKESFLMLYKTCICPHLEYCVQQRATKLVPHLPYKERLKHLDLYSLYCRRQRGDLIEVYKLIKNISRVSPDPFSPFSNNITRGHDQRIFKQHYRINPRLNF